MENNNIFLEKNGNFSIFSVLRGFSEFGIFNLRSAEFFFYKMLPYT
jgi:hypothetical protein